MIQRYNCFEQIEILHALKMKFMGGYRKKINKHKRLKNCNVLNFYKFIYYKV